MVIRTVPEPRFEESRQPADPAPVLDVVVPVHNEQDDLGPCVRRLHEHLTAQLPYSFRITVADNASTDDTLAVAHRLAAQYPQVRVRHLDAKGRGRALKAAWSASDADILCYMDVDLSTDLAALLPLIAPLVSGHSDLAVGSRLCQGSRVVRGAKRELISRCYNLILRGTLGIGSSDAQCGFKAVRRDVAGQLLPLIQDTGWFFDTELLVLAQRAGLRVHEVPVDWVDDPDSRVDILATAVADLRGIVRLGRDLATGRLPLSDLRRRSGRHPLIARPGSPGGLIGQLFRFGVVGAGCTVAYLLLYLVLREPLGAQGANLVAMLVTAVANTAANRRLTFGVSGVRGAYRHHVQGMLVFLLGLGLTSGALALLHAAVGSAHRAAELAALVAANLLATVLRFLLLRAWVFGAHRPSVVEDL